jgi:flagellar hook-associated protein 3 FlgL
LQAKATTEQNVTALDDNPTLAGQILNQQTEESQTNQYQSNITQLQNLSTASNSAITALQTLVSKATEITTSVDGLSSKDDMATDATQVAALIQQALALVNTQYQGNYIFGGNQATTQPFTATTDADGNVTAVTYSGDANTNQVAIGPHATVSATVPGANTTGIGERGLVTDTRYGADLFNHLIALQQHLAAGDSTTVSTTDSTALNNDDNNIINQVASSGAVASQLQTTSSLLTTLSSNLSTSISSENTADIAQTMTQLSQAQTAYQAALESGVKIMGTSLLNYLPVS